MISADLANLLAPLERFEAIRRRAVRMGDRLSDLSYANPYGGVEQAARTAIRQALDDERLLDLQYTPFGGQTLARRAVADALRASHGLPFAFGDVVLTPGAMAALQVALRVAGTPGDEVVIPVPCWLDYPLYARALGLVPVGVPLAANSFDIDVAAVTEALSPRTCAVLLSHPANPTGRNYGRDTLAELADAIREAESELQRPITLIADETHRDFVRPGEYRSLTAFFERTLIVYSFGKYHFMQGQRIGYAATSPNHQSRKAVADEMVRWTRITGLATPTSLMQRAVPRLLALEHEQAWVSRWRQRLLEQLSSDGYSVVEPDATLFMYVETPAGLGDFEFVEELASNGVLALPAPLFHHSGYFRLSLTGSERMLEQALPGLGRMAPR